jgi:hypothetical protein
MVSLLDNREEIVKLFFLLVTLFDNWKGHYPSHKHIFQNHLPRNIRHHQQQHGVCHQLEFVSQDPIAKIITCFIDQQKKRKNPFHRTKLVRFELDFGPVRFIFSKTNVTRLIWFFSPNRIKNQIKLNHEHGDGLWESKVDAK